MCDERDPEIVLRVRNKAKKLKIQLGCGTMFDVFSCIKGHDDCLTDCANQKDERWVFWKESQIALHICTRDAISAVADENVTLKWVYSDEETLEGLNILSTGGPEARDVIIEKFSNAALNLGMPSAT